MTFLEHGDIRKSGRAILIACTIFVLLNECSEAFTEIVLFGFEVRITREMLVGFLQIGIWALCVIFVVRFTQGFAAWEQVLSGGKAAEARESVLVNQIGFRISKDDSKKEALKKIGEPSAGAGEANYNQKLNGIKLTNSEYLRFYFRRSGDFVDALLLQVILPLAAVIYAFWMSPALTLVCKAAP